MTTVRALKAEQKVFIIILFIIYIINNKRQRAFVSHFYVPHHYSIAPFDGILKNLIHNALSFLFYYYYLFFFEKTTKTNIKFRKHINAQKPPCKEIDETLLKKISCC